MIRYVTIFYLCIVFKNVNSLNAVEIFAKVLKMCNEKQNVSLIHCIKERSLIALDSIYRFNNDLSVIPNVISIIRYNDYNLEERSSKVMFADIQTENLKNKSLILDDLIIRRIYNILGSRAINIKVPLTALDFFNILKNTENQEGRGKKDKGGGGMLAMGAMMAGAMMAIKIAAIAAMAGKALMASLMAIMIASLAALSKRSNTHGSTYEVINVPTSHGHHSRRSIHEMMHSSENYSAAPLVNNQAHFEED